MSFDPSCELCEAARISPWFHEDDLCWVADCEACMTPMVVWRPHGVTPTDQEQTTMMGHLERVAAERFGEFWIDPDRRSIPGHWHVHARPKGRFYGHG